MEKYNAVAKNNNIDPPRTTTTLGLLLQGLQLLGEGLNLEGQLAGLDLGRGDLSVQRFLVLLCLGQLGSEFRHLSLQLGDGLALRNVRNDDVILRGVAPTSTVLVVFLFGCCA